VGFVEGFLDGSVNVPSCGLGEVKARELGKFLARAILKKAQCTGYLKGRGSSFRALVCQNLLGKALRVTFRLYLQQVQKHANSRFIVESGKSQVSNSEDSGNAEDFA